MTYQVGIIGAGRIAAGFDTPESDCVLTHAHAVQREPRMELAGFWDLDPALGTVAARRWGTAYIDDLDALVQRAKDVIVLAVPDEVHEQYLRRLISCPPRLVICEKPLTLDIITAKAIADLYAKQGIPLLVNFQRRFDPAVLEMKRRIGNGELGRVLGGVVWYSKGTKHNGSHAIDLLRFLFGEPQDIETHRRTFDYRPDDPTVSGRLDFGTFEVTLIAGDEQLYSLFEIDLLFECARYRFSHSGLQLDVLEPRQDPVFAGYVELFPTYSGPTGLSSALGNLMNSAADYLDGGSLPGNTAEDAVFTQELCTKLIDLAMNVRRGGEK